MERSFKIYNFRDTPALVTVSKEIREMLIRVLSGDEVVTVNFTDGTSKTYDSSDNRLSDFDDGGYVLYDEESIDRWINFEGNSRSMVRIAYQRLYSFGKERG